MSIRSEFEIYRGTVDTIRADIVQPIEYEGWRHFVTLLPPKPRLAAEIMGLVFYFRVRFIERLPPDIRRYINSVSLLPHTHHTPGV